MIYLEKKSEYTTTSPVTVTKDVLQGILYTSQLQNASKRIDKMPPANNTDVSVQHKQSEKN